jgi:hypothetical protein
MSPYEKACELYDYGEIEKVVADCLESGVVLNDKDVFLCLLPTESQCFMDLFNNSVDIPGAWFVYVASGDIARAFNAGIEWRDYLVWDRFDGNVRVVRTERVRRIAWAASLNSRNTNKPRLRWSKLT